jgi:NAD(P)-dependent dehydrogenase (short-subunit alcohol dehydrogenase family)
MDGDIQTYRHVFDDGTEQRRFMGECSDKKVVITGGSSGMGLALAELLVRGGAHVVITGRSQAKLYAARELLPRGIRVNAISPGPIDSGILGTTNLSKRPLSSSGRSGPRATP